ncbi:MAG: HAMP domain-containing protein, partial [Bacteroidia bacterium]|nr:HAMP domain-containing protein [Bacteroidia bacterium]
MTIRQKLTLQFLVLSFAMLAVSFGVILFSQYSFRKEQFNDRLAYKARSIADDIENLGEFSIEQLRRIRRSGSQLFSEQVFLFDHNGSMLFAAPEAPFRFQPDTEFVNLARSKPDFFFDWEQYECYALTINAAGTQHLIVVAGYDQFGHGKMENLREFLIILLLSGLVISAFTGWFFAGKALDPVSEIVRQVDTITAGNLNTRLDEGMRRDELNRLAMTFNLMLNRIEQAFEAQKTFVANASHEL